ncbi:TetR/AcrR family transcriptional regulator [Nocardia sp. NBC_00511]|uniref:TetR/AcrR family transcriptional regulator n=1 Tax=Nocardia sp. NBC_00511 TaxID=2903591 RepID=UPI0030E4BD21
MSVTVIPCYDFGMRWEPDGRSRLEQAALELYRDNGFEKTTVTEIAARAGLTERTFFRHFADKREVLFGGAELLREYLVGQVDAAAPSLNAFEAVITALIDTADTIFEPRREPARLRQRVIEANTGLRERELVKLADLGIAISGALRERGSTEPEASLAAESGIAVLRVAFQRWTEDPGEHPLAYYVREAAEVLANTVAPQG